MKSTLKVATAAVGIAALAGCSSLGADAGGGTSSDAEFPGSEPITFVVPFSAGGSTDLLIRGLLPHLEEELGTKVLVENKTGAGGQVGVTEIANAPTDGYVIGFTNLPSTLAYLNPDKQATYDRENFQPVALLSEFRGLVATGIDSEFSTIDDLVSAAKEAPGEVTVGIDGLGGDDHIVMTEFEQAAGIEFKAVPYDDGSEKMNALMGGQIDASFGAVSTFSAQLETGNVAPLAVLEPEPVPGFEEIPTVAESGYDVDWASYNVVSAPAGLDSDTIATLGDAFAAAGEAAMQDEDFQALIASGGYDFGVRDAKEAGDIWDELQAKWEELMPIVLDSE